jgi:hypothetical protein
MTEKWVVMLHKGRGVAGIPSSGSVFSSCRDAVRERKALQSGLTDAEKNQGCHFKEKCLTPTPPSFSKSTLGIGKAARQGFGRRGPKRTS